MAGKSFLIDTTRCTGCRGCQAACKQWNENPGTKTIQRGTYQNPPDLSTATFKLVRFSESTDTQGEPEWYFFPDQCRHCLYPLCKMAADKVAKGAVTLDSKTRATIFNPTVKISPKDFEKIRQICPFDIPRYDEKLGGMAKCTMCVDRVGAGMLPACVKACPTGTMQFGDRDDILKIAKKRLEEVQHVHSNAVLVDPESIRVIFLLKDDPKKYYEFAEGKEAMGITGMAARKSYPHPAAQPELS
jgi:formate dehydrogenase iron-sulfur subunit